MNLQKSMLGRISTSVVSQISSSLFSPSINQSEIKERLEMWVMEAHLQVREEQITKRFNELRRAGASRGWT